MAAVCNVFMLIVCICMNEAARVPLKPVYERSNDNFSPDRNPFGADTPQEMNRRAHIHVRNQQQRYNLEKDRKQKAMMERNKTHGGETMDSYVKAYQEQHEEHQRDVETKLKEEAKKDAKKETKNRTLKDFPNAQWWLNARQVRSKRVNTAQDFIKMKNESQNKNRVTRIVATGSNNMPYILNPNYMYVPIQTYGENLHDFTPMFDHSFLSPQSHGEKKQTKHATSQRFKTEGVNALTKAALSHTHAQHNFNQLANYKGNVESLNALLGKKPTDQLRGFTELLNSGGNNHKLTFEDLTNSHINIDASSLDIKNNKRPTSYINVSPDSETQDNQQFAYSYKDYPQLFVPPAKDHTPITENVQDVEDTEKPIYTVKYVYSTENPVTSSEYYTVKDDIKVIDQGPKYVSSYTPAPDNMHYASQYEFGYRVSDHHSGNDFGHQETSDGESTKGSYHVLLPDGRIQKVSYVAGPSGFHADISYQ